MMLNPVFYSWPNLLHQQLSSFPQPPLTFKRISTSEGVVSSCIEQQKRRRKKSPRENVSEAMIFLFCSCWKSKRNQRLRKIIFHFSASRNLLWKGKFFSSQKHASRELYETSLTPVSGFFLSPSCAVVYWRVHFSFLSFYDSFRFSTIFLFTFFFSFHFICAMRWWCFLYQHTTSTHKHTLQCFSMYFSIPFEIFSCATNFTDENIWALIG